MENNGDFPSGEHRRSTADRSDGKTNRIRVVLTAEQAREIFRLKGNHGCASLHSVSTRLASQYNVSSKAIRDIWKGRSWLDSTFDLWDSVDRPPRRIIGRPKGKKDSKPRSRGASSLEPDNLHNCPPSIERVDSSSSIGLSEQANDMVQQISLQRLAFSRLSEPAFPLIHSALPQIQTCTQYSRFDSSNCIALPSLETLIRGSNIACQRFIHPALPSSLLSPFMSANNYDPLQARHCYQDSCSVRDGALSCLDSIPALPALLVPSVAGSAAPLPLPGILLPAAPQW
jgi:hypothetical protein